MTKISALLMVLAGCIGLLSGMYIERKILDIIPVRVMSVSYGIDTSTMKYNRMRVDSEGKVICSQKQ